MPYTTDPSQTVDVLSGDLEWIPMNDTQRELWKDDPPRPVHKDVVIGKLRQGQEIELLCYAVRGVGKIHAKWSPVCTATYRLKPDIVIKEVGLSLLKFSKIKVFKIFVYHCTIFSGGQCGPCAPCG